MDTLLVSQSKSVLSVTLHRPDRRNAMNAAMVRELLVVFTTLPTSVRVVVLRGTNGTFCAGGDVSDMLQAATAGEGDPPYVLGEPKTTQSPASPGVLLPLAHALAVMNRSFGEMLCAVERAPVGVVAVCEGAVMGGGLGLACVADVSIAVEGARFRLPEVGLGVVPAQIAPFVARKIGVSQARRLALEGVEVNAAEALRLGLAHYHTFEIDTTVRAVVGGLLKSEPSALAATKALLLGLGGPPLDDTLDAAARIFSERARSEAAAAGFAAFLARKPAPWAEEPE